MNKKAYSKPELKTMPISSSDILAASEVLIFGGDLFGESEDN